MKKVLCLVMVLLLGLALFACEEEYEHEFKASWTSDDTHHWKECVDSTCEKIAAKAEHNFVISESGDVEQCSVCGKERSVHTHVWSEWNTTTPATCTTKGKRTRSCSCGESEDGELEMQAHTYDAENTCGACGDYKDKGVIFTLENGTYTVRRYTGDATEVIIPTKYKNIPVTCIGQEAFSEYEDLENITLPVGITTIEGYAFYRCSALKSIRLPDGLTSIGDGAFQECISVNSITIPDSVTSIEDYAFFKCTPLNYTVYENGKYWGNSENRYLYLVGVVNNTVTSFEISDKTRFIGCGAFSGCMSLTSIEIPEMVTTIDAQAFFYCRALSTITFSPNCRVEKIGSSAFYKCTSLQSFTIPASVKTIGAMTFEGCNALSSVTFAQQNGWWVSTRADAIGGQDIPLSLIQNSATMATYFKVDYCRYYWSRSE